MPGPVWTCPEHSRPLHHERDILHCPEGCAYPVRGSVPRFVESESYTEAFGEQWLHWRRTQLDSYTGSSITRDRMRRELGEEVWTSLRGKHVLECGCGAGRFTEILLAEGANVTSIDMSAAVDANAQNFPPGDNHRVAQADILALPFAGGEFDLVFCLGVLQHTPVPEDAIAALARQIKPGGWLAIDHYADRLRWYSRTAPLYRAWMRRRDPRKNRATVERLVAAYLPLHRRMRGKRLAQSALYRISPLVTYYDAFPQLRDELQREWALLDTHDSLTDYYKHFRDERQIREQLLSLGLHVDRCETYNGVVEARARAPLLAAQRPPDPATRAYTSA